MRNLEIRNGTNQQNYQTNNKTIMDMVVEYAKQKENLLEVIQAINHIKIYKKNVF